jgi:hypothetical protein
MLEVVEAVKAAVPDAAERPPGAVLEHVLETRWATVRTITEIRTVLFAPAKFVNDLNGPFYSFRAKSLANLILC